MLRFPVEVAMASTYEQVETCVVEDGIMPVVTFQVLEGIDKGRIFRELPTPVTIGREEGNVLRLNDERVSRFHAKVQFDNGEIILTDLESTNGTRVNGNVVQIRRLRPGDRVGVGRSLLLFGSEEEIAARNAALLGISTRHRRRHDCQRPCPATVHAQTLAAQFDHDLDFDLNPHDKITVDRRARCFCGNRPLPPLPQKMTPVAGRPPGRDARLPAPPPDRRHREHPAPTRTARRSRSATPTGSACWPCRCCWLATSAPSPNRMPLDE